MMMMYDDDELHASTRQLLLDGRGLVHVEQFKSSFRWTSLPSFYICSLEQSATTLYSDFF